MDTPCRLQILGAEVDLVTPAEVLGFVARKVAARESAVIANHNLHSLYLYHNDDTMRQFYARADLIEIDSTPLIAWAKLLGLPVFRDHRSTYLDFRDDFWGHAIAHNWRVYHIGGAPEHCEASRAAILERHPHAHIEVHHGFFDADGADGEALVLDLLISRPDVLLIGMGMPRQEHWILKNLDRLPPCVILPVGGAFDYESGVQYLPPRWTADFGIEWLARFVHDPRRLFNRYFIEPWGLVPVILGDVAKRVSGKTFIAQRDEIFAAPRRVGFDVPVPERADEQPIALQALRRAK